MPTVKTTFDMPVELYTKLADFLFKNYHLSKRKVLIQAIEKFIEEYRRENP